MSLTLVAENKCFGGRQMRYSHRSTSCDCDMVFSAYLPPQAESGPVPALYWLSGLTCTDENFVQKAGVQAHAAKHGLAIIAPDTSPRGPNVPDDPNGAYDFGLAAGFYVNATQPPFSQHYHMYDYVTNELPALVKAHLPVAPQRAGIFGHSMGGHGALTIALKNPDLYQSVSAFSPIVAPSKVPWGHKAFRGYLGNDQEEWLAHDACALIGSSNGKTRLPLLVDQGGADAFLEEELCPHLLKEACDAHQHPLTLRIQAGYDHSYFFIASFMEDHIIHHAKALG